MLFLGGRRVAQGADVVVAEEDAEADAGADHAERGEASADVLEARFKEEGGSLVHEVDSVRD